MAVALKVSESENYQLLWRGPDIQTLVATAFNDLLTSLEVVVGFAPQTRECIGLLGVTLQDITLDSPGDTDPSAGRHEQRAAAVVAAEEPLQGDTRMTAAGSPKPEGSDCTAGLGCCMGEPLMTRPPGYSLPSFPSFILIPLANIDGAVRRYSRQTNDNCKWRVYFGKSKTYEAIESTGMR